MSWGISLILLWLDFRLWSGRCRVILIVWPSLSHCWMSGVFRKSPHFGWSNFTAFQHCDLQNLWLTVYQELFSAGQHQISLCTHTALYPVTDSREPLSRFLVLLLWALSKSPIIHSTNPNCPSYLRLQSLCPPSRKTSTPSLGSALYATVWIENGDECQAHLMYFPFSRITTR